MSATRDVIEFARKNGGVFTTHEAEALGLPRSTLGRRVADGIFVRVSRGVLALPGASSRPDIEMRAAGRVMGAVVSHESAALLHGLTPVSVTRPSVTVSHRGSYGFPGLVVHQSTDLLESHMTTIGDLRVTTVERTIVDLAKVLGRRRLSRVVENALSSQKADVEALMTLFQSLTRSGKKGMKNLGEILTEFAADDLAYSESDLEMMIYGLLVEAGLPRPVKQFRAPWLKRIRGRVDLAYVDERIVIEGDGRRWHTLFDAFTKDHKRDNAAMLAGWIVLRYTWQTVTEEPELVVSEVRGALEKR